jgi:sugar/nucleoside kinase (ribokinase family)
MGAFLDTLKSMCELAQHASAMCVEREGAMESIPALAEVQARMGGDVQG